jgi:HTH-type transcriptional regulator / antitoxin HigA
MNATQVDPLVYAKLLRQTLPTVIHSEEQNERYIKILDKLTSRDDLSPEEEEFAALLTLLIENFEEQNYAMKPASPVAILKHLMESNGLKQKDLVDVFGTEGIVSEVINGKREFSKEHIRRLAKRFHVSPELFF